MNLPDVPDRPSAPPDRGDVSQAEIDQLAGEIEEAESDADWLDTLIDTLHIDFTPPAIRSGAVSPELVSASQRRRERITLRLAMLRRAYNLRDWPTFGRLIYLQMQGEYVRRAEDQTS